MKLIITRHGQTTDNHNKIIQGQMHGELSEHGKRQAKKLAKRLSQFNIDVIYSSDLKRSADTAKIIQEHVSSKIIYTKALREIYMGDFEGEKRPWNTIEEMKDFITNNRMKGESLDELYERAKNFYQYLIKQHPKGVILLVGHTAINQAIINAINDESIHGIFNQTHQKNTAVNIFQISGGGYKTLELNCTKHLDYCFP